MTKKKELVVLKITVLLFVLLSQNIVKAKSNTRAFPGAEGFGAYTPGGRGGKVLFVTNLEDYDPKTETPIPGSLRAAIETQGPS